MAREHLDVVIIGAGISGIDAGCHMLKHCPHRSFAILERRANFGGTWDLFRYPGIRSDSDMFTFGYYFKPWRSVQPIAPGANILDYLRDTIDDFGLRSHIRFDSHIVAASWSSPEQRWKLQLENGEELTCGFLWACTGYYNYDEAHNPHFEGSERFNGRVVHPQWWTPDVEYEGKRVAVVGSGATAITLVPSLAKSASHVTMVQRSPTFLVAAPPSDRIASILGKVFPEKLLHALVRGKNVALGLVFFNLMRRYPSFFKKALVDGVHEQLKNHMSTEEIRKHFTPNYNPWDQRLCLSPAGDFFDSLREGRASIVTGHIDSFTEDGILMQGGQHVAADVIVTATGLKLQSCFPMSTMQVTIDGQPYNPTSTMVYKGSMLSGVPNFAFITGYTNASWTLKADLTCLWVVRLLQNMERSGHSSVVPQRPHDVPEEDVLPLTSGYIQRAKDWMPKQGAKAPWRVDNNYLLDAWALGRDKFADAELVFSGGVATSKL